MSDGIVCHAPYTREPSGRIFHDVAFPIARFRARLYCKYCYRKHSYWHLMSRDDYGPNTVVLCGKCESTSVLMLIENVNESRLARRTVCNEPPRDCGPFGIIGFCKKAGVVRVLEEAP